MERLLEPTPDLAWVLATEGFDQLREAMYESRFSISNGLIGLRAGRPVSRGQRWAVPERAYLAGLFDVPGPEHPIPALVPAPGWEQIRIMLPGGPLVRHPAEAISHRTTLDMRRGVLLTGCRLVEHASLIVGLRTLQLLSLSERSIGLQLIEVKIEEGEVEVSVEASFEGLGLWLRSERIERDFGLWRTKYTDKRVALAAALSLQIDGSEIAPTRAGPFMWSALKQMKSDASEAEARLEKLKQAGNSSWSVLSAALTESRKAFDEANQAAWKALKGPAPKS